MSKTAIVTGGARGIGLGICKKLANEGYNIVMLGSSSTEKVIDSIKLIESYGVNCLYVQGNVADPETHINLLETTLDTFGRVDVLVNNAGVAPLERADLLDMTMESYDRVMGINLRGPLFLTQLIAKQMATQEERDGVRGFIVNVSSMSASVVSVTRGEYCLSKAGVSMMTSLFAARMAGEKVFVYEVQPGIIETQMVDKVKDYYTALCNSDALLVQRWGQPEDIAAAVWAFCSGAFLYSPGQVAMVDGGFTMQRL